MERMVTIVHDNRVYEELRRQVRFNRRVTLFALVTAAYMVGMKLLYDKQEQRIQELSKTEGE